MAGVACVEGGEAAFDPLPSFAVIVGQRLVFESSSRTTCPVTVNWSVIAVIRSYDSNDVILRESKLRSGYETCDASFNVLLTPVIDCDRQSVIFYWLLPFVPKIYCSTVRFVFGFINPDSAW